MVSKYDTWFTNSQGLAFYPWRPDPNAISLADIAHTLSIINRWGGHTRVPYNVAQHSVFVSNLCEWHAGRGARGGLFHDATEAYMGGDIISPIKVAVPDFEALEAGLARCIERRFGFADGELDDGAIHWADRVARYVEYRDLMPKTNGEIPASIRGPGDIYKDAGETFCPAPLRPWDFREAETVFLAAAQRLGIKERDVA